MPPISSSSFKTTNCMGIPKQGVRCCSVPVSGEKLGAHSILAAELLTQHGSAGTSIFSLISAHRGRKAKSHNSSLIIVSQKVMDR